MSRGDVNILLVDDRPENLAALEAMLSLPGYNLVTARSGPEALKKLLGGDWALILLDLFMPGMDGFEVASLIKGRARTRQIPIVFLTAAAQDVSTIYRAYSVGAVDYIQKPIDPDIVRAKVKVFVELYRQERALRELTRREVLSESERRYRNLAEAIPQIVFTAGPEGEVAYFNHRWLELTRVPPEGDGWLAAMHPEDADRFRKAWSAAVAAGEPFQAECRLMSAAHGDYAWHLCRALPEKDEQDRVVAWLGTFTDIDAQKRGQEERQALLVAERMARAELHESQEQLFTTLRSIGDAVIATSPKGSIELMSHAAEVLTGWSQADAHGRPLGEVLAELRKSGRLIEETSAPIRRGEEDHGNVLIFRDVTGKRREEQRRRLMTEAATALLSSLDYQEILGAVTRLTVPALGDYCVIELPGVERDPPPLAVAGVDAGRADTLRDLRRRSSPDRKLHTISEVMRTRSPILFRAVPDQALVDLAHDEQHLAALRGFGFRSAVVAPLIARGRSLGAISLFSAESGRVFGEEDVVIAEELAWRVAVAVDNARLYGDAQRAVRLRDDFMSIASHELRTPLTALQLQLQGLQRVLKKAQINGGSRLATRIQSSVRQTDRLAKLVDSLLDVSRISTGRLQLQREELDLAGAVRDVVERFAVEADRAGCAIDVDDEPTVGRWDRLRIEQVVTNLLSNAIKYAPGKPIEIEVHPDGDLARLVVRDHGIGIAPAALGRIFGRYERAVPARHYGGLGLGLYITHQIVEAHGGSISARSKPGEGATFTVELPRSLERSAGAASSTPAPA